ncbi:MAG: sugar phosphate isomerase/epimerase [Planctomycetes bacterium]|nr:sugar phosphate isomerase/epimerase [Planctomycetota bacterium]
MLSVSVHAADPGTGASFNGPLGLQLYSLRADFAAKGVAATLDQVKGYGIKYVELAGTYNLPAAEFKKMLDDRGLIPVSGHFPYKRYATEPDVVAKEAKALGLPFAGCAWIDHKAPFDDAQCREVIEVFNKAGEALSKEGVKFFYHLHGFEFQPQQAGGTLADLLISRTNPNTVFYQMDVLWVVFPGQDPVKLLDTYGARWVSMHLKDLKKGIETGSLSGKTDVKNNVVLGTGQMNWPAILAAAKKAGLKYYFIEDESPDAATQIPQTMKYLEGVKFE